MTKLTTATYVKIALVILLCLVLCGGIFSCSVGCSTAARHANNLFWGTYESYELTEVGNASISADSVHNIEIDWPAGSVRFEVVSESSANRETQKRAAETSDEDVPDAVLLKQITLTEANTALLSEDERMRWEVQGDTLKIGYGWRNIGFSGCSMGRKELTISIPESAARELGSVIINGASGSYDLGSIGCERLDVNLASGQVSGDGMRADRLSLDVASGTVRLKGDFSQYVGISLASGGIDVDCTKRCPRSTDVSVASGTVTIGVPAASGITTTVSKMSGSFNCDFPNGAVKQNADGWYVVGDGEASFNAEIMSGQVTLRANDRS